MIRGLTIAVLMSLSCWYAGADTVTLKPEAFIKGPTVMLGDVADIEGEHAEALRSIAVTHAALPGSSRRIDASLLRSRIVSAGYDSESVDVANTPRIVTATTMHLDVTRELLMDDLRNYIHMNMPWDPEETLVDIVPPTGKTVVADGDMSIAWRANPAYKYLGLGSFRGDISVDGQLSKTVYAKATIKTYADVLVTDGGLSRGTRLTPANVHLEKRDLSTIKTGVFFGLDELNGAIAKSSIRAGQIITPDKVMAPKVVKRNQIVRVRTQVGAMVIQSQAQALSDGSVGDVLRCRNLKSKEEFTGVVGRDGILMVY